MTSRTPSRARRCWPVVLLALVGAAAAAPVRAEGGIVRFQGEELYYGLEFFGSSLARGALVVGHLEPHEGTALIPVEGLAVTEGVAALVYPMRDSGSTWVDPDTGLARTTTKELNERGEYRRYRVDFTQTAYNANVERLREGVTNYYERVLPSTTHDAFSWVYAVREQDLTPGATRIYYVFDGWKLSRVTATVAEGDEHVLVGEEFIACRRINLYREVMESTRPLPMIQEAATLPPAMWVRQTRSGEQVGDLWISNDERRLPVQMVFTNQLISATARLQRYRPPAAGY